MHAFAPLSGSALAVAQTWWYTNSGEVVESDVRYNSNYGWTLNWDSARYGTWDVQSVALHEIGHATGLGDIYPTSNDFNQIMNSYDGPQHYLGLGDITGLRKIYGP